MAEARYQLLARQLSASIANATYKVGSTLPSEIELAQHHAVSRSTVRAALDMLETQGLIERRRGAGTTVLAAKTPAGFGQTIGAVDELIQYARDTRRVIRSIKKVIVDIPTAERLGLAPGSAWLRLRGLRIAPQQPHAPICLTDTYIDTRLAEVRHHLADETSAVCDLLERYHGVRTHSIEQELQGALIDREAATLLGALPGAPALRILRRYSDAAGWIFEFSDSLHPADRFSYRMRLDRTRQR
jgi:GntR family transcriptional regulator